MTPAAAVLALAGEFEDEFPALVPTASIQYEGAQNITAPALSASWVRFGARPVLQQLNALGSPRLFTSTGLISIQIFTPQGRGRGASDALAESAVSVFRGRTDISGIRIGDIRYTTQPSSEGFFQQTVLIEYEVDDLDS